MKRMVELQQQQEEEECTQEEMVTRFERERSESIPTGSNIPVHPVHLSFIHLADFCLLTASSLLCLFLAVVRGAPPDLVLRLVEDPEFRYEDFAPRGEQSPPTMRAQVVRAYLCVQDRVDYIYRLIESHIPHYCLTRFTMYSACLLFIDAGV